MLRVKTRLGPSPIEGLGVFAAEFIPKGTVVWDFHPPFDQALTEEEMALADPVERWFLDRYVYRHDRTGLYVHCGDNGRFINHSDSPNLREHYPVGHIQGQDIAARDIQPGEELTCDYKSFDLDYRKKL